MEDLFKGMEIVQKYSLCRNVYPPVLSDSILKFLNRFSRTESSELQMVEVACGGGQCTKTMSQHFKHVLAFDISEIQLETAKVDKPSNVQYTIASADAFPCADESADLVLCAEAVHLLNWETFLNETNRVLKPDGTLALVGYWMPKISPLHVEGEEKKELSEKGTRLLVNFKLQGGYSEWVKDAFESRYRKFLQLLPWKSKEHDISMKGDLTWSMTQLMCYVDSLYNYKKHMERMREEARLRKPEITDEELVQLDYGRKMRLDLKELWGVSNVEDDDVFMKIEFPLFLVLGCRKESKTLSD